MFSRRSWFPDPLTCGWRSESRTQTDYDSHIWHRCHSPCCVVSEWIVPWIIVASIWKWKEFSLHICPWDRKVWDAFPAVTDVFYALANPPFDVTDYVVAPLQRWVIYLCDKTCNLSDINEARQYLFCQKTQDIENVPPIKAAPLQHTQRAVYQACYIWSQALVQSPLLPDPLEWGWKQEKGVWEPNWMLLPQVVTACGCEKSCRISCRCAKAALTCSALSWCLYGGFCF